MSKLRALMVFEILGRPAKTVSEGLETLLTKLGAEKGVKILEKNIHEPISTKEAEDIFTAFAEIEVELDNMGNYFGIIFAYMPSNVEIINPERLTLTNQDLNELAHALTQRLHNYDAVVKKVTFERNLLLDKIKEISPETFKQLTEPPKKKDEKS